jgi:hypothetical protein
LNTALFRGGPLSQRATSIQVSVAALVVQVDRWAVISGKKCDIDMFGKGRVRKPRAASGQSRPKIRSAALLRFYDVLTLGRAVATVIGLNVVLSELIV